MNDTTVDTSGGEDEPIELTPKEGRKRLLPLLGARTIASDLVARTSEERMVCVACAHRCGLKDGERGICGVRVRSGEELRVPFGYVARKYVRPVEINTVFHLLPGALSLTFGMFGCDLACPYCQNAYISQAIRDGRHDQAPIDVSADALVEDAVAQGCKVVCAAYNEPMISVEWVKEIFTKAKERGLATAVISDGHTTREALAYLRPVADVFRVDVKAATAEAYRSLGGDIEAVWTAIAAARELGYWVELVTLVVPGLNDDVDGLRKIARRIAKIDRTIPWHVNGFVPRYRMKERPATSHGVLVDAAGLGLGAGLDFVYASNVPSLVELAHTRCPSCAAVLVERNDYKTVRSSLDEGRCACGHVIPGVWG